MKNLTVCAAMNRTFFCGVLVGSQLVGLSGHAQSSPSQTQQLSPLPVQVGQNASEIDGARASALVIQQQLLLLERLGVVPARAVTDPTASVMPAKAVAIDSTEAGSPALLPIQINQCPVLIDTGSGVFPSDVTGATGVAGQLIAVNSRIAWRVGPFSSSSCNRVNQMTLRTLLRIQNAQEIPLHPQVHYDPASARFFVTAITRKAGSNDEYLYLTSIPDAASGPSNQQRTVYRTVLSERSTSRRFCKTAFADVALNPMLGVSTASLVVTADTTTSSGNYGSVFAFDKAAVIAGKSTRAACFSLPRQLNIAPSNVLNPRENANSMILLTHTPDFPDAFGKRFLYQRLIWNKTATWTLEPASSLTLPEAFYTPVENLKQPDTTTLFDVQKVRFNGASTQIGANGSERIYNVHAVNCRPRRTFLSCLRFYNISRRLGVRMMGAYQWYYTGSTGFFNPTMIYNGRDRIFATASFSGSSFYPGFAQLAFKTNGNTLLEFQSYTTAPGTVPCTSSSGLCPGNTGSSISLTPISGTTLNSFRATSFGQLYRSPSPSSWKIEQINGRY